MNSSISSSERSGPLPVARWRSFAVTFTATAALLLAGLVAFAFLIDPYDSGRSPLRMKEGVRPQGPRTALASRGRDPAFRGAIFGNSHVQLLEPEQLKAQTGIPFVSLIAPATGPKETLDVIDWFLRNRREPAQALVVGLDNLWCTANPAMPPDKPFPFWLLARNLPDYVRGLTSFNVLEESVQRLHYLSSRKAARAVPDGYWNYEPNYLGLGYATDAKLREKLFQPHDVSGKNPTGPFPVAERLRALLDRTAPDVPLILLRTPIFRTALPAAGSPEAAADAACRDAFAKLAASRPRTVLVDWKVDRPENRDPDNYFDQTHYRMPIARLVERDIAQALETMR